MRRIQLPLTLLILLPFFISSCSKKEGKGGRATITGQVRIQNIDLNTNSLINEYPAVDHKVFITYGDNEVYDDDFSTDVNGNYKFEGLRTGDYTIQTYLECKDCTEPIDISTEEINISDSKGTTKVPTTFLKNTQIEDGNAVVIGKVLFQDTIPQQQKVITYPAIDHRVYLVYGNETVYRNDFKTDVNGYFRFDKLNIGNYKVYVYTCDNDCVRDIKIVELEFSIENSNGETTIQNLIIKNDIVL